jgi:DNA-binding CsgD family transcriptional regulator
MKNDKSGHGAEMRLLHAPQPSLLHAVLHELGFGVALVDLQGNLICLNWQAQVLLWGDETKPGEALLPDLRDADQEVWNFALEAAARGEKSMLQVNLSDGPSAISVAGCQGYPDLAVVTFERRSFVDNMSMDFLVREYRLTPAEQRVVRGLMRGDVPKQIAQGQGIAVSTIRTQIKHTLSKMDARGIYDLILKVARLPSHSLRGDRAARE